MMRGHFAAIVLIAIGLLFLLRNLGMLNVDLRQLFSVWWPLILIVVGIGLFFTPSGRKKRE